LLKTTKQQGNKATKQQGNKATRQQGNKATRQQGNKVHGNNLPFLFCFIFDLTWIF